MPHSKKSPPAPGTRDAGFSGSRKPDAGRRHARLLCALSAAIAAFIITSCGSRHAVLELKAPATVVAGVPFSATVTALYNGQNDTSINGPIHFTTTDTAAHLPTLYVFTAADAGSHTFDLTLFTPGMQSITVSDYVAPIITGSSNVMVSAASPNQQLTRSEPPKPSPAHQEERCF